ncbi:MAG: carbohydrate kinase family protein [Marmoricola sp.]
MPLLLSGSIATDHLMTYGGTFSESLIADQLHNLSVSFLVDALDVRRGGVAANIGFGLGRLGVRPVLVASAGKDFGDYRAWLEDHGVDCDSVRISETLHTARFVCTTDRTMAQIASFYPGAMSEAGDISLGPVVERVGTPDYVVISANDPAAMARHTIECREAGYPFIADPSQQLSFADGELIRTLVDGAAILCSNEYESHVILEKTGWTEDEVLSRVGIQVTTLGADGVRITQEGAATIKVAGVPDVTAVEPTGAGDAFRSGFLAALSWGLGLERAAQTGCVIASYVVESIGTQEYTFTNDEFIARLRGAYGDEAAADVQQHLG